MDFGTVSYIGHLHDLPLVGIFHSLAKQNETGLLFLKRDKVAKKIYLKKGRPFLIERSLSRERLIRHLLRTGAIAPQLAQDILSEALEKQTTIESVISSEKTIPSQKLLEATKEASLESLRELFSWDVGQYVFFFDKEPAENSTGLPILSTIEAIIFNSIKDGFSKDKLNSIVLDELDEKWTLTEDYKEIKRKLNLTSADIRVVRQLDGSKILENIIFSSKRDMRSTLSLLVSLFLLKLVGNKNEEKVNKRFDNLDDRHLSADDENYAQRLIQTGPNLLELPPFDLLEIGRDFNDTDLRKGYYKLAQRYHQREIIDRFPTDIAELSGRIFERISTFFEALLKYEKSKHDKSFDIYLELDDLHFSDTFTIYKGMIQFIKGKALFDQESYEEANSYFSNASEIAPFEGEYRTYRLLSAFKTRPDTNEHEAAEKLIPDLRRSATLDSKLVITEITLGEIYETIGKIDLANKSYKNALDLDPSNKDVFYVQAQTELKFESTDYS